MKAFISYSSKDSSFVDLIAADLTRYYCIYDKHSFDSGTEFEKSIEIGLDSSSIFVLIATKNSITSNWVNYEIRRAKLKTLNNIIDRSVVYICDTDFSTDTLPHWLKKANFVYYDNPKLIARDIKHHLDDLLRARFSPYFVGRNLETEYFQNLVTPIDGSKPPYILFINGLTGIGRRTFIQHSLKNVLNFKKVSILTIENGDNINDICIKLTTMSEPYSNKSELSNLVSTVKKLNIDESITRIINNIKSLNQKNELLIFVDEGGLLDDEGYLSSHMITFLQNFPCDGQAYLFIISNRKPQNIPYQVYAPTYYLKPLNDNDTKKLLTLHFRNLNLSFNPGQISELSEYIAGYPPAAFYAAQICHIYGIELILADKSKLIEFRTSVFINYIQRLGLNEESKAILKLLCNLSPLPIDVISNYYSININSLSKTMVTLIDMSLIQITESGYYKIADPISESAYSYYGTIGKDDHYRLCNIINDSITNSNPQERNYDLWRVMFKAARLSGYNEMIDETLELNSDIISVIQKHYFENNYEEAYRLAKLIIEARPDSGSAYWFLIRSLIHLEKYGLASEAITQFQQFAPQRDILFLRGFLERKRNNIDKAIEFFDDAKRHGKHGVALFREMGLCHLLNGDLDNSIRYLNLAIGLQPDNSYVIDLIALVATYMKNEHEARRALEKLRIIDQGKYFHRLSRVEFAFGNIKAAREAASRAVKYKKTIPFEAKAQLILCEIAVGNIDEASNLIADLEKKHGNIRKDIQIGLLCRLKIAKNEFEDALINIERMSDHNSKHYKIIKRDILKSIVESGLFDSKELLSYQQRADELESQIDQYYEEHYLTNYDIYL